MSRYSDSTKSLERHAKRCITNKGFNFPYFTLYFHSGIFKGFLPNSVPIVPSINIGTYCADDGNGHFLTY